jgi:hypothetical protein
LREAKRRSIPDLTAGLLATVMPGLVPGIDVFLVRFNGCAQKDNMARVLKSANPLDNAPNWTGKNYLGTGWTFTPKRYVVTELNGGIFLEGNLITTRGATMPEDLYA